MQTHKIVLSHIDIVGSLAKVEIEDAYGVDLLHLPVCITEVYMFGDSLCHAIKHTLEIVEFARVLYFHDNYLALAVLCLDIHAIELVVRLLLIAFALKDVYYLHLLIQEYLQESLKHIEVGFLTKQSLDSPVKTYISVSQFCHRLVLLTFRAGSINSHRIVDNAKIYINLL